MSFRIPFYRVNWTTSSFLIGTFLIAIIGVPLYIGKVGLDRFQVALFFCYLIITMMSITLGYHRLLSHRTFTAKKPVELFTLIFGACAFEGSALEWCSDHRRHHKHVDHDDDPYDISKGFFWAHIGWLLFKLRPDPPMDNVTDLRKDRLVMWQYEWVYWLGFLVGLILPAALGFIWNFSQGLDPWTGALGGFLLAGVARIVVAQHCTFLINSLCHTFGSQPYSTKHSARDSTIMAILTFGEGYHNFHHEFPFDYRNGAKTWCWDPTKWTIWVLSKVGLASDLRRVSASKVLLAEMSEAKRFAGLQLEDKDIPFPQECSEMLHELYRRLVARHADLEQAVGERKEIPWKVIHQWRKETRKLVDQLARPNRIYGAPPGVRSQATPGPPVPGS